MKLVKELQNLQEALKMSHRNFARYLGVTHPVLLRTYKHAKVGGKMLEGIAHREELAYLKDDVWNYLKGTNHDH